MIFMPRLKPFLFILIALNSTFSSCNEPINLFSVQQDIDFGSVLDEAINKRNDLFPILNETLYSDAYIYLYTMRDEILIAPQINYKDRYDWQLKIIHNDSIINAFCNPGGYLYIYTGLLKNLDKPDYVAGVLAHLIAQSDQRLTTVSLTNLYGTQKLMEVANNTASSEDLNEIIEQIPALYYNINQKKAADNYAVDYLRIARYACNSTALFFDKISSSTLQNSEYSINNAPFQDRIDSINAKVSDYACSVDTWYSLGDNGDYAAMLATLP